MILTQHDRIALVDFGLSEQSRELEAKGVDLHLMKRALQSTHYKYAKECFNAVKNGYIESVGREAGQRVIDKIEEIEKRGRYVSER
jgi:TP53 regulating kinase-like protein